MSHPSPSADSQPDDIDRQISPQHSHLQQSNHSRPGNGSTSSVSDEERSNDLSHTIDAPERSQPDWSDGACPGLDQRFEIVQPIGRGTMGEVFRAHDSQLGREVAVKRIAVPDSQAARNLDREARVMARISHPNVVTVHDVKLLADTVYIISEYIDGQSLDKHDKPLPLPRAVAIARDLARGLAAVHEHDVLHRDIKPANAIVDNRSGQAKLIDFGVAKLVEHQHHRNSGDPVDHRGDADPASSAPGGHASVSTGSDARLGTPRYWAPERWDGSKATRRADVYSFGALLYELLTGEKPPSVADPDTRQPIQLARSDIDIRLRAIVNQCVALDPAERFESGSDLASALDDLHNARPLPKNPYRGLFHFREAHSHCFFGRDDDVGRILDIMSIKPFVLMVGNSGVGKSSLAYAGLFPRVRSGHVDPGGSRAAVRTWLPAAALPGRRPVIELARQLADALDIEPQRMIEPAQNGDYETLARELNSRQGDERGLVFFIDQLEELITVSQPGQAEKAGRMLAYLIEQRSSSLRVLAAEIGRAHV